MRSTSRVRRLGPVATIVLALGLVLTTVSSATATAKDTGKLAFVRANQIYSSTSTGASVTQLTTSGKNYLPHWSPDGKRIAFVHEAPAGHRDIWVMQADGTSKKQVTHLGDTTEPTWSPDGKWLAFGAEGNPPYDGAFDYTLHKIRSTAPYGNPVVLPTGDNDARVAGSLAWSPDGKQIAFVSHTYPASPDSFLLTYTISTHAVDLVDMVGGSCCGQGHFANPAWTPNSKTIAYSVVRYPIDQTPPTGAHLEFASMAGTPLPTFPEVLGDSDPDYSPTGKKLVFSHFSRIYTANATGTQRTSVLTGYSPDWQPVG
jgi:Tol biopolymer transport system component